MSKSVSKFVDAGETIYSLMDEILVQCPRCHACACIIPRPAAELHTLKHFTPRRAVCSKCGYTKEWEGKGLALDPNADPMRDSYFGLPLWLQAPCCGKILWAYNYRHLRLIEEYVQAALREHKPARYGTYIDSLANCLPEWMIIAKHRHAVLDAVEKLKRR